MWGDQEVHGMGPEMRHMAEVVHWILRIPMLQLPYGGAHVTHRLDSTGFTLRLPRSLFLPDFVQELLPTFPKAPCAPVIGVHVGQHTDAHLPLGLDGEGAQPAAAVLHLLASLWGQNRTIKVLIELLPFSCTHSGLQVQF